MLTRAGVVAGTPGFMAPEQARAEDLDQRVDVYALGATLFYVLAGDLPFATDRATELMAHVGANRAPDWSRLPAETPPELRAILAKAMAADRRERYADAGALAADLRAFVTGQLVGAHRYGRLAQLRRFIRRHRAAVAVAAVAMLVIAAGGLFSIRRIVVERDDATRARALAETRQREAVAKSDELLVQNALHLVARDAAAAIAMLRRLPPESAQWPRAAVVAEAAAARGIPIGFSTDGLSGFIAVSPDSRHVVAWGPRSPQLVLIDLITRERRERPVPLGLRWLAWLDERWLVGGSPTEIILVDPASQASRAFPLEGTLALHSDRAGHGWIRTKDGRVFALDAHTTALGGPILEHVDEVDPIGAERLAIRREDRLELWTPTRSWVLAPEGVSYVDVHGARLGAQIGDEVCVWNVAAEPVRELCHRPGENHALVGITDELIYLHANQGLTSVDRANRAVAIERRSLVALGLSRHGFLIAVDDRAREGSIVLWDRDGRFELATRPVRYRQLGQTDDGRFVIALTSTGEVMAWDLPQFRPREARMVEIQGAVRGHAERAVELRDARRDHPPRPGDRRESAAGLPARLAGAGGAGLRLGDLDRRGRPALRRAHDHRDPALGPLPPADRGGDRRGRG